MKNAPIHDTKFPEIEKVPEIEHIPEIEHVVLGNWGPHLDVFESIFVDSDATFSVF